MSGLQCVGHSPCPSLSWVRNTEVSGTVTVVRYVGERHNPPPSWDIGDVGLGRVAPRRTGPSSPNRPRRFLWKVPFDLRRESIVSPGPWPRAPTTHSFLTAGPDSRPYVVVTGDSVKERTTDKWILGVITCILRLSDTRTPSRINTGVVLEPTYTPLRGETTVVRGR